MVGLTGLIDRVLELIRLLDAAEAFLWIGRLSILVAADRIKLVVGLATCIPGAITPLKGCGDDGLFG